jgi:glucose/mannose transport system substrate-binding protein
MAENASDDASGSGRALTRRRYVAGATAAAALGIAGCTGGDSGNGGGSDGGAVEIVHWWTAGGEKDAFDALLEGFEEAHPDVEVEPNPAPGGAGSAIDTVIQNRVLDGDPPSTFQIWPGQALTPYTDADLLEDIGDSVWDEEMRDAYLDDVVDLARPEGDLVAVPINIHRLNNLFYNVEVVESAGVDPAAIDDPEGVLGALETVAAETDATPMAHQTQAPWSSLQLWENIFLGQQGVDTYRSLIDGDAAELDSEIRSSLELMVDYADYYPEDAGSISWDEGNGDLIDGDAAFIHQGDWAAGQYETSDDFEFGEGWDMVPFPGTDGVYHSVIDSFVLPSDNPTPEATETFLDYAGTADAQERFNPVKGSIPPRTDVPTDEFGPFLSRQIADFGDSDAQPPTIAHGTAVEPGVASELKEAIANFNESGDLDATTGAIVDAF